jgi:hypothetical protein
MFHVIDVVYSTKWGIDFTTYHLTSSKGHRYIIVAVEYFTKWVEAMQTFNNDGETMTIFIFNQIVARFGIPKEIFTDHGSHFQKRMMTDLTSNIGFWKEHPSTYYPQENGQVEAVNKSLNIILQWTINFSKPNWHLMLYSALWAYRTSMNTANGFSPFQIVYGMEAVLPIDCQIPSFKLVVELLPDTSPLEERLPYLEKLDEQCHDEALSNESHKK